MPEENLSESASIRLSIKHKGRTRREPVWIARYRIVGKDSAKVLGKAWTKRSRAPNGYLTRREAHESLRGFLADEGARVLAVGGMTFGQAADRYLESLDARIRSGSFRPSTLGTYRNIIETELRPRWHERPIGTITRREIAAYHAELVGRGLAASTINRAERSCAGSLP